MTTVSRLAAVVLAWLLITTVAACSLIEGDHVTAAVRTGPLPALDVVIDTDMFSDDWMAILYLASEPDVTIRAVTVANSSPLGCADAVAVAHDLLADVGRPEVPVACGPPASAGGTQYPAEWGEGVRSLAGSLGWTADDGDPPGVATAATDAVSLLRAMVADGPVTILSLGPPTNLAALLNDPTWDRKGVERIIQLAGAVDVPGNVAEVGSVKAMPSVEWNAAVDPTALATVLGSDIDVSLVALDGTNSLPLRVADIDRLTADRSTRTAKIFASILDDLRAVADGGGYYLWDSLATVTARQPDVARVERIRLRVSLDAGEAGRTVRDPAGREIPVTMEADAEGFERILLDALLGRAR
jgi:inosine-uridine nucleoside N-ribohydrolase